MRLWLALVALVGCGGGIAAQDDAQASDGSADGAPVADASAKDAVADVSVDAIDGAVDSAASLACLTDAGAVSCTGNNWLVLDGGAFCEAGCASGQACETSAGFVGVCQ